MFWLRSLGGLEVECEARSLGGAAARPRPLALLALIASGRGRGMGRERLLAYLWPERDTEHARNCLKQTLFALRQDVHDELFVGRAGLLRLNPAIITTDVLQFEAAWARGAHHAAVALYRGPFLEGFHLSHVQEFDQWVESERLRLALYYRGCLEALGTAAYEAGDCSAAVEWWRKLTTLAPLNSRFALGLMRSLVGLGNPAEALIHARVYERLVHTELGTPPDTTVSAYADWLRQYPEASLRRRSRSRSPEA
ncbi:MAG TPA: BTAD domain-containing putative transcriptional regulator [Gemmatimonadales bacterium]|nr:BTAD domain-containing putative transcriptional regulator [Gemmatimonadales bacterium]